MSERKQPLISAGHAWSDSVPEEVVTDESKRDEVFNLTPNTILIKIGGVNLSLPEKVRDQEAIVAKQKAQADRLGVNFQAYRLRGDSGKQVVNRAFAVSLAGFIKDLADRGYGYAGGHHFIKKGHIINVLQFTKTGDTKLPANISSILESVVLHTTNVWANQTESGRVDTVNGDRTTLKARNRLVVEASNGSSFSYGLK